MIMKIKLWINWPIKKHKHSDILVSNIDGPTSPKILPTWSHMGSSSHFGFLSYVWIKIKILSTPTANTKNGITCNTYYIIRNVYGKNYFTFDIFRYSLRWWGVSLALLRNQIYQESKQLMLLQWQHLRRSTLFCCLPEIDYEKFDSTREIFRVKKKNLRNILSRNILSRSEPRTRKRTLSRNWSSLLLPLLSMIVPTHPRSIFPSYTRYPWTLVSL